MCLHLPAAYFCFISICVKHKQIDGGGLRERAMLRAAAAATGEKRTRECHKCQKLNAMLFSKIFVAFSNEVYITEKCDVKIATFCWRNLLTTEMKITYGIELYVEN